MNKVVGHPVPYKIGRRRSILVSYVSMREWQSFGDMLQLDDVEAVLELLYYSLRRAEPTTTRKRVRRLAKKYAKQLLALVDRICDISLPKLKKGKTGALPGADKTAPPSDPSRSGSERNIKTVYRLLSRMHGWSPQQIGDMSPAQVYIYLTGGPDGTGIVKMSNSEYQGFLAARRGGLN